MYRASTLLVAVLALAIPALQAQEEEMVLTETSVYFLPVTGRVTDGEKKLSGCLVKVYQGNELVQEEQTDRAGRFDLELDLGPEYTLEFSGEGFLPKRVVVDTRTEIPVEKLVYGPLAMDVNLMIGSKYEGVDTDVLDFPFALVRYDKQQHTFAPDRDYSMGMQRANGALLLMSARAGK
ncbi:MAG: carboxypeptidase-like regulatory domain-containing protein [Flavobacteriales bacterium]|nr:carboxypeptidase regulatory-like domain-containing protein [Flavobacteriales bacterium]MCB0783173.1 carboxypeptidase regulatory-like domain-containing protein [Flavobacteriales bacterium]MCB0788238.1 carboxypeptidase regulatory-like domain-containing protein [Flavobacteriales bacterium]MCB0808252.1 carboxypeptidase regulatory-like domain-containing protein [Flavobacteriales bacterium]MCB0812343.1 carboxypeptidase regulatory-like domain-containing protein [Flavobacteriales bacterium]